MLHVLVGWSRRRSARGIDERAVAVSLEMGRWAHVWQRNVPLALATRLTVAYCVLFATIGVSQPTKHVVLAILSVRYAYARK